MGKRGPHVTPIIEARNQDICELYGTGRVSLESLGRKHGITRERVRQVLVQNGVDFRNPFGCNFVVIQGIPPSQEGAWATKVREIRAKFKALTHPEDLAAQYELPTSMVKALIVGKARFSDTVPGALTDKAWSATLRQIRRSAPGAGAQFTFAQVKDVRERVDRKELSVTEAARELGICGPATLSLLRGRTYKGAGGPLYVPTHGAVCKSLGPEGAKALRERFAAGGVSRRELAPEFGVSYMTVLNALTGDIYPNAGGPLVEKRAKRR